MTAKSDLKILNILQLGLFGKMGFGEFDETNKWGFIRGNQ